MSENNSVRSRWFPTTQQLKDPEALERAFRQVLTQHYALQDSMAAAAKSGGKEQAGSSPAEANGPSTTKLLGLNVEPVDTQTLANGATLKYNASRGTFSFQ